MSDRAPGVPARPPIRRRSPLEVRWRQFRSAPRPVVRAVLASLGVAVVLGLAYLAYDVALARGVDLPGGDLRTPFLVLDVVLVVALGSFITYLVVPGPVGPGGSPARSKWSAALGLFAAVPIAYLALVVVLQVLRPLIV